MSHIAMSHSFCKHHVDHYSREEFVDQIICNNEIYSQMLFSGVSKLKHSHHSGTNSIVEM